VARYARALVDEARAKRIWDVLEHVHGDDDVDTVVVERQGGPRDDLDHFSVVELADVGSHDIKPVTEHPLSETFRARTYVENTNPVGFVFERRVEHTAKQFVSLIQIRLPGNDVFGTFVLGHQ